MTRPEMDRAIKETNSTQTAAEAGKPRVVMPADPEFAPTRGADQAIAPPAESFRPMRSIAWAFALAIAAASGWALISVLTGYQLGLIAIVVGVLAGVGAAKGGRSKQAQIVGAVAAAFAYFLGQAITVIALLVQQGPVPDDAAPSAESPRAVVSATMPTGPAPVPTEAELAEAGGPQPVSMSEAFGLLFLAVVQDTFTSMGVLFLGIAVWEGWRIPRPQP